tara:strand:- start:58703 stop:60445 length:1743 start_codon:yes stop_codon:yes gene_type:complete
LPALIGKKLSTYNALTFASVFGSTTENLYLYIGKVVSWDDDTSPPTPEDTDEYHNSIYNKMAGMVRINADDVSVGTVRNDWTSNTVYSRYHHSNTSIGDNYYVLAGSTDRDVYKCLDNNGDSRSTSKPTHKNLGITREPDGYAWKYLYTIKETDFIKFATANVIPVSINTDVARVSRKGGIIHLPLDANNTVGIGEYYRGAGYVNTSYSTSMTNATIFTTVNANTATNEIKVIADSGLSPWNDYYNNTAFFVTSGLGAGTLREVIDYKVASDGALGSDGATTTSANLVLSGLVSEFANGDSFILGAFVGDPDNDLNGSGFLGIAKTNRYGNVTSIDVSLIGRGYANGVSANVVIKGDYDPTSESASVHPDGTNANVEFIIPPSGGGHGYNPFFELAAKYVIVAPQTLIARDHQTGIFSGYGNDYRQVGIIRNPEDSRRGQLATRDSYDLRTTLYFATSETVNFQEDQRVYNSAIAGSESASGLVYTVCGSLPNRYLALVDVQGQFANGDIIYNRLGDSATISSQSLSNFEYPLNSQNEPVDSVMPSSIAKYTGQILYHENISPITRRTDQKEQFKFVFEF